MRYAWIQRITNLSNVQTNWRKADCVEGKVQQDIVHGLSCSPQIRSYRAKYAGRLLRGSELHYVGFFRLPKIPTTNGKENCVVHIRSCHAMCVDRLFRLSEFNVYCDLGQQSGSHRCRLMNKEVVTPCAFYRLGSLIAIQCYHQSLQRYSTLR